MSEVSYVLDRIARGDSVRFFHDFYGAQGVELASGRILRRKQRILLSPAQVDQLKGVLRRHKVRRA